MYLNFLEMAKPIKPTPVLRGADALNFHKRLADKDHKVSVKSRLENIRNDARILKSLIKNQ